MTAFYALCGSGCGLSGYFPNKVELIPHQSKGCLGEGCPLTDGRHTSTLVRAPRGHVPAGREVLARTLLDLCAQGAVLFSTWFLF
jgi:hypothetical protein